MRLPPRAIIASLALALVWVCAGASAQAAPPAIQEFRAQVTPAPVAAAGHPAALEADFQLSEEAARLAERDTVALPSGLFVDGQAARPCSVAAFEREGTAAGEPACGSESIVGSDALSFVGGGAAHASVYDLEAPQGMPLELGLYWDHGERLYLKGRIGPSSDYQEYLELEVPRGAGVERSVVERSALKLEDANAPDLLIAPSACTSSASWHLGVSSAAGTIAEASASSAPVQGCELLRLEPLLEAAPETTSHDEPDGITIVAKPQVGEPANLDVASALLTLPPGLTLDLSAAHGLEACTQQQAAIGQAGAATCPAGAQIAAATLESDILPEALSGAVYLASPDGQPLDGGAGANPEYPVYLETESARDGVSVRLEGVLIANHNGGRVQISFADVPQLPFDQLKLKLSGGPTALLANPLDCDAEKLEGSFTPYSGSTAATAAAPFASSGCPSPLPFALSQSTADATAQAGAATAFAINLGRAAGEQYLATLNTTLPAGMYPRIPTVPPCAEAQASAGSCGGESEIGSVAIEAGAGSDPIMLAGRLFLTGASGGPYGFAIAVPVLAGPFDLGLLVARAKLAFDSLSGQMTIEAAIPRIVKGIPLRLRRLSVTINRPGFLYNPGACGSFRTLSVLGGFTPGVGGEAHRTLYSPLQIGGCAALAFKPSVAAAANAKASLATGVSFEATINVPSGDATVRSMTLQLPRQLVPRTSEFAQACPEATFEANPYSCSRAAFVGGVRANTPMLPAKLTGPVILVAPNGSASPDLDLVLEADDVRLVLSGATRTAKHVTTVEYTAEPDLPLTSMTFDLSTGAGSAFVPNGEICALSLLMPTTIDSWSGQSFKRRISAKQVGCGVRIVGHKVIGDIAYITVKTFGPGRISASGSDLQTVSRSLGAATGAAGLLVPLDRRGRASRHPLRIRLRVGFRPKGAGSASSAYVVVHFR